MEGIVYYNDGTNVAWWPLDSFKGVIPISDTTMNVYLMPYSEVGLDEGLDNDFVTLTIGTNKHKEVCQSIAEAFVFPENNLIKLWDSDTGDKIDTNVSGATVTTMSV